MRLKHLSKSQQGAIPCGYCFQEWATGYDHLVPYSKGGQTIDSNLYPCCKRCNSLLHNKEFDSITEKREYVRDKLIEKGIWEVPDMQDAIREETPTAEIRSTQMPQVALGVDAPTGERAGERAERKTPSKSPKPKRERRVEKTAPLLLRQNGHILIDGVCFWCGAFDCESMQHNYRKEIVARGLDLDDGGYFEIHHEDGCQIYLKSYCNCQPVIEIQYDLQTVSFPYDWKYENS
jgi:hypothetical protein